jgi:uncharacterized membrane protein (UPF0127 family)
MRAVNSKSGVIVAANVVLADTPQARAKGLLGRSEMATGEGLWIVPCSMIHTFFMRFAIDVLFLDKGLKVVRVSENLAPWRISPWLWRAHSVLELAGGSLGASVKAGDTLKIQ